ICDQDNHRCRTGCKSDTDCPASAPKCDVQAAQCVQCLLAADCKSASAPLCSPDHTCVQCLGNEIVDPSCPMASPFCKDFGCVQCLHDKDCPMSTPKCDNDRCVQRTTPP